MLNKFLTDYFGFNRQQRNGLLVLLGISFLLFIIRITYPYFITPDNIRVETLALAEQQLDSSAMPPPEKEVKQPTLTTHTNLFVFNPNTVSLNQLLKLGFKEKAAKRFLKFRNKGFVFKKKQDLKKLYGMTDDFYAQLEPYLLLEEKQAEKRNDATENTSTISLPLPEIKTPPTTQTKKQVLIELNSADSLVLLEVDGIGPSFAKRILKYRGMLGGFVSLEQLKEVYGITDDVYQQIYQAFTLDASKIKKLNLLKDDFKTINKHPYLSYQLTKSIFDWRRKTEINALTLKGIINDDQLYAKLLPYLVFN